MREKYRTLYVSLENKFMNNFVFIIVLFISFIITGLCQTDKNNYGPYQVIWEKYQVCKGPKQTDCGKFEIKTAENMSDVIFNIDFPKDCPATAAKVVVSTISNNITKKLWNYALNKPCEHFVLGPILMESFNLTKNCKINKGQYDIHLDMQSKALMFLGKQFFYGVYSFKTMSFNKANNFFCVESIINVKKYN